MWQWFWRLFRAPEPSRWTPQPRHFAIVGFVNDELGEVVTVFERDIYMQHATYDVWVNNGKTDADEFGWGYTVRYRNLGPDGATAIADMADAIVKCVQHNENANGELTAKLTATVDGAAVPPQTFKITQLGLTKIQREIYHAAAGLLDKTEKHAHDKAKRKHP